MFGGSGIVWTLLQWFLKNSHEKYFDSGCSLCLWCYCKPLFIGPFKAVEEEADDPKLQLPGCLWQRI